MFFKKKEDREYVDSLLRASLLGLHMVATTFIGLLVGLYLDKWLDTSPWLTMIFLLFGIAAGFKNMFQEVRKIQSSESRKDQKKDE
ncbi:MAG: AtpZ/AtpI family protein [Desulfohalobiaceae bacterium]|nr:AtpZ/AtpI family protein [Desulfohalobiaceae bacterium]